ncbi:hypothetical protein [Allosphingosinicella sp.]|jgi:hypothetical protein|uniref:hypothetical protein n=1 Tax=Allosphingosinicella sp. TaxID=2823234 RepID=UPI002F1DDA99
MMMTMLRLALLAAVGIAAIAPASAQPGGTLGCAIREMPAEARASLRSIYARNGLNVTAEQLVPRAVVDRIAACLPAETPDRNERLSQLVAGLMSYEMMNAALDSLESRHSVRRTAVEAAWPQLSADEKLALLPPGQRGDQVPRSSSRDAVLRFAGMVRPSITARNAASRRNAPVMQDLLVYAISRAVVENMAGRD